MAHAIRHAQQGEVALLNGAEGILAVGIAAQNMIGDNIN